MSEPNDSTGVDSTPNCQVPSTSATHSTILVGHWHGAAPIAGCVSAMVSPTLPANLAVRIHINYHSHCILLEF